MFQITHNGCFVQSVIKVTKLTKPFMKDETLVCDLMYLWANKTAIPYINWMRNFKTDDTIWYVK